MSKFILSFLGGFSGALIKWALIAVLWIGSIVFVPISAVRKIDEGIGGSREQAENERHKLSSEMRKRAWALED